MADHMGDETMMHRLVSAHGPLLKRNNTIDVGKYHGHVASFRFGRLVADLGMSRNHQVVPDRGRFRPHNYLSETQD